MSGFQKLYMFLKTFFCDNLGATGSTNQIIFAGFALSNSVLGFYLWSTKNCDHFCKHFPIYFLSSFLCFGVLTRDCWKGKVAKLFPLYWHVTLMVCLPLQTLFMVLRSHGDHLWLFDFAVALILLKTITELRTFVIIASIGSLFGVITFLLLGNQDTAFLSANLAIWAIIVHVSALFFFLLFFRKKDREIFYHSNAKLGHELGHFWKNLSVHSKRLELIIPSLVQSYKGYNKNGTTNKLTKEDLEYITKLSKKIANSSNYIKSNYEHHLLEIGILKEEKKESFSASKTILMAFEQFAFRGNQDQKIQFKVSKDFHIYGHQRLLVPVLINLMRNAFAAISGKQDGTITVSLDHPKRSIVIKDTGTGIAKTDVDLIFDESFSTKKPGHGLGLFYCKSAMIDLGGDINCTSEKGSFTRFELSFSITKEDTKYEPAASIPSSNQNNAYR